MADIISRIPCEKCEGHSCRKRSSFHLLALGQHTLRPVLNPGSESGRLSVMVPPTFSCMLEMASGVQLGKSGWEKLSRTSWSSAATIKLGSTVSPMNGTPLHPSKLPIRPDAVPCNAA